MTKPRKVLVLGATGAMGQHLVPLLAEKGYQIDGVAFDEKKREVSEQMQGRVGV